MKKLTLFFGLWPLLAGTWASAAAFMDIQGKLVSFTSEHYLISRNHQIFYVKRSAVPEPRRGEFEKTGVTVEVMVDISDIDLIKTEQASAK